MRISGKILVANGVMVAVIASSLLYMRSELKQAQSAVHSQAALLASTRAVTRVANDFGDLKYWLSDLELTWFEVSEDKADQAEERLAASLKDLGAIDPEAAEKVGKEAAKLSDAAFEAVDLYMMEDRAGGNKLAETTRASVVAVDQVINPLLETYRERLTVGGKNVLARADSAVNTAMLLLVLSVLFPLGITFLVTRMVSHPIGAMTGAMQRLAKGDRQSEIPAQGRKDEIGEMAAAVQVFKENAIECCRLEKEVEEQKIRAEEEKRRTMHQMADDFDTKVGAIVQSVSAAARQMQSTANSMSAISEETSSQASTVASASEQASTNVRTVASAAEELAGSISEISRQVDQSSEIARKAVEKADQTNDQIQGLAVSADRIGEVIAMITDIADQTNLLALNATIEAARAGDAGKGFAVVASEVKNLANQTAKATEEISAHVGGVQSATKEAVTAIDGIGSVIGQINEIATTIASAVEEQGAATQEISRNVQQAASGTHEVSSSIQGVTQAATEAGSAAGQVLNVADQLSEQATSLKIEVDKFIQQVRAG